MGVDIDVDRLKELQGDKATLIIDVREPNEIQETGILPGAINIPLGDIPQALAKNETEFEKKYNRPKPKPDTRIVFSCRSGKRSLAALTKAKELGFNNLLNFAGGWIGWENHLKGN